MLVFPSNGYWAKLSPRDDPVEWHPLADHCHDVAACFEALVAQPVIGARLAALAGRSSLPPVWIARLTALVFLHDFGKVNHAFQERTGGHIAEAAPPAYDAAMAEAAGLLHLGNWTAGGDVAALEILAAILAHHGAPPALDDEAARKFAGHWARRAARDPVAGVADLIAQAQAHWPAAFAAGGEPLPPAGPFWHGVLGLLQLADWLGSDAAADAFPFSNEGDPTRRAFASARATELLRLVGLDVARFRADPRRRPRFGAVAGFPGRPIQLAAGEAPGPIVVLEAETGSGKTEAALYRFARLFCAGKVDGLYFALPTRVAASQMMVRVQAAAARLFPDPANRPVVVRALPGDAGADGETVKRLPGFETQWSDDPCEAELRRRWAAEGPKRYLAAPIAVGTIDQALLGAVRVKHAQLRSMALARSLLVVDEVHASDRFMSGLLQNLLRQHLGAGGEALLLSATLGAEARTRLMLGHRMTPNALGKCVPACEAARAVPYPAISTLTGDAIATAPFPSAGDGKRVRMESFAAIAEPERVAAEALTAARAGARVLLIRNTVRDAVATREALEKLAPSDPILFRLAGVATLHHGRFAREDRRRLDAAVEDRLGKAAPRDGGLVIAGTQTLEISLDLDADLLVTDLCLVDVLLQRIGRLHRHERERPAGFEAPRCLVLTPDSFNAALATVKRERMSGPHGLGTVYPGFVGLEATRRLIGAGAEWRIPAMNRVLVEAATHGQALDGLVDELESVDPRWREAHIRHEGRSRAEDATAKALKLAWDRPVSEFQPDENAATRLGARNLELVFDPPLTGAFGEPVTRLVVPHHLNPFGAFEPADLTQRPDGFTFRLGEAGFIYDGLGLRRDEAKS